MKEKWTRRGAGAVGEGFKMQKTLRLQILKEISRRERLQFQDDNVFMRFKARRRWGNFTQNTSDPQRDKTINVGRRRGSSKKDENFNNIFNIISRHLRRN